MNFTQELLLLIKAKYPIIYITTHEEERVEYIIKHCTQELGGRAVYTWDFIDGYTGTPFDQSTAKGNPIQALNLIEKLTPNTPSLFIMKDFDIFFKDVAIIRKTKNVTKLLKIQPKNMIIISSKTNIPESLQDIIITIMATKLLYMASSSSSPKIPPPPMVKMSVVTRPLRLQSCVITDTA